MAYADARQPKQQPRAGRDGGIPYILFDGDTREDHDQLFWIWVAQLKAVDVDYLRHPHVFSAIAKVREMRFRFEHLLSTSNLESDFLVAHHLRPGPQCRLSARDLVQSWRGATPVGRDPSRAPRLGSPQASRLAVPRYSGSSDTRATSRKDAADR